MLGFDDGGARGGVAGYEVREAREAGGELGFVAGAGVGHGCSCLLAFFFSLSSFSFWGGGMVCCMLWGDSGASSLVAGVLSGGER